MTATDRMAEVKLLAPHIFIGMRMLGWDEFRHDKDLTKYVWPATDDCRGLHTVIGSNSAWCSGWACAVCKEAGLATTRSGSASSWQGFGVSCGYTFGAILPIQHKEGGHHVNFFLWWIDEANHIAACLGANQNNMVSIGAYNLSGNKRGHDEVITGPRWWANHAMTKGPYQPDGWKIGTSVGGSTR